MPCFRPLHGYKSLSKNKSGKRSIVFNAKYGYTDLKVTVPCGSCIGCKLERSRQWAIRILHEAEDYTDNCFITLTYDDDNLPYDNSLNKEHFKDFIKRLRWSLSTTRINPETGRKKRHYPTLRYYMCGEYGDQSDRPHYHALIFNHDFPDKVHIHEGDNPLYYSAKLTELWGKGYTTIGELTFETAAYCARYCTKKITGDKADDHYYSLSETTGELHKIIPEYNTMSRNKGIGHNWITKYKDEVYPEDEIIINGKIVSPPKYYDNLLSELELKILKGKRKKAAMQHEENNTAERLHVRETIKLAQYNQLKRGL